MSGRKVKKESPTRDRMNGLLTLIGSGIFVWVAVIFLAGYNTTKFADVQRLLETQSSDFGLNYFLLLLIIAIIFLVILSRKKIFGTIVAVVLSFLIYGGASLYFGFEIAFFAAVALFLYERISKSFFANDLFVLMAVLFGSLPIGIGYPVGVLIVLLVIISIYDLLGVFATWFIPRLAKRAVEYNVPLLLIAPRVGVSWNDRPQLKNASAILGSGDIFLPAIFLTSVSFNHGVLLAVAVFAGAIVGGLLNLFLAMLIRTGIPAMPLLAGGMLAAYFLAL